MFIESLANSLAGFSAAMATGYSSPTVSPKLDGGGSAISTIGGIQVIPASTKLLTLHFSFSFTTTDD
jgi:hypothetical protein